MDKPKLIMLVGSPGAGKSTFAKDYSNYVRISQDDQGKKEHMVLFHRSINQKKDLLIDRMNFDKYQRERYLKPARDAGYETSIHVLYVSTNTCVDRCVERKNHPTIKTNEDIHNAITFFFRKYEHVEDSEADSVIRHGWVKEDATKCIWSDLDGTLANVEHRRKYVRCENRKDRNWPKFFDEMVNDPVNEWCRVILSEMQNCYPIVYATGRPADYSEHTELWLDDNHLRFSGSFLFMRPSKDHRRDDIIKKIILDFEVKTRYNILFAIDDRKQVVDMLRENGVVVLQCDIGDF